MSKYSEYKILNRNKTWVAVAMAGCLLAALIAVAGPTVTPQQAAQPQANSGAATALSHAFRDAVKRVQPAVVMVTNQGAVPVANEGRAPGGRGRVGMGTGVIIDPAGVILTNNHVVRGGEQIMVRLHDGREFKATKVSTDPKSDLAVLRIEGADHLQAAVLGDSDRLDVGEWVIAVGHPFGLEGTVTAGIVSAKGRGIGITEREDFIQTDAAINPGNSGGPLVNLEGEVVGINTAIHSNSGGNEGVGFAIPINQAKWVAQQLANGGTVHRATLGVMIQPLTDELAKQFDLAVHSGVLVAEVTPDSAAAKAGLKPGDVIVEFAGKSVTSPRELQVVAEQAAIGTAQTLIVIRDGKRVELKVSPNELPGDEKHQANEEQRAGREDMRFESLGMNAQTLTPELAERLHIRGDHGVVVTEVRPGSRAQLAGLVPGTVIVEANRKPVKTVEELAAAIKEKKDSDGLLLLVRTGAGSRFVIVPN